MPCPQAHNRFCENCFPKLKSVGQIKMKTGKMWTLKPPNAQRKPGALCAVLHQNAPMDTVDGCEVDEDCVAYWVETMDCINNHDHAWEYSECDACMSDGSPANPYAYDEAYDVHDTPWYQAAEAWAMHHESQGHGMKRDYDEMSAYQASQLHGEFHPPEPMYNPQQHANMLESIRAQDMWSR